MLATPVAVIAGGVSAYRDASGGNYAGAALAGLGAAAGVVGAGVNAAASGLDETAGELYNLEFMRQWLLGDAGRLAALAQRLSAGSFLLNTLLNPFINPATAWAASCLSPIS